MPSNPYALLGIQEIDTLAEAIAAGRITPDGLQAIMKACVLCEQRQIAKASQVDAWPSDLAPSPRDCNNPKNVSVQIRQHNAHSHR